MRQGGSRRQRNSGMGNRVREMTERYQPVLFGAVVVLTLLSLVLLIQVSALQNTVAEQEEQLEELEDLDTEVESMWYTVDELDMFMGEVEDRVEDLEDDMD